MAQLVGTHKECHGNVFIDKGKFMCLECNEIVFVDDIDFQMNLVDRVLHS